MRLHPACWALAAFSTLFASCGDPPELVEKGKELDAEIEEVTQKLADIRKELKVEVSDVSAEYDLSREQLVIMKTEATRLETELIDLRDEMESLESRFSNYRKSHPIN